MATEAGELIVKISADVQDIKDKMSELGKSVSSLGAGTVAQGNLMSDMFKKVGKAALDFVKDSIAGFAEQEQTMTRLSLLVGGEVAQSFKQYSEELQRTTEYSDDQILSLEKQLTQYGIYPGSVKEATRALLDFAAITGKDLPEAGSMLAKAMAGQSRELKQYGLDLSATASRSQNLETTVKFLQARFEGAAQTMRGTTLGAVESLKNNFADLEKELGEYLAPTTNKIIQQLSEVVSGLNLAARANKGYADTVEGQKQHLADFNAQLKAQVINGVQVTAQQKEEIQTIVNHIHSLEQLIPKKNQNKGATDREIESIRQLKDEILKLQQEEAHLATITSLTTQKKILGSQQEVAQLKADNEQITAITQIETEKRLATSQNAWETNASYSDQLRVKITEDLNNSTAAWVDMTKTMLDSFANSTARMIVEGGKFSDVIKSLWTQLAEAIIGQIIRMIAEWVVFQTMTGGAGGFAGGFMAEGGMINEPSMLIGLQSGSRHMVGEAGPEEVVPRNRSYSEGGGGGGASSSSMGGGSGGDGGVTINISGQFLEGSPAKWQRMVQEVIAPQMRRLAMKDPNSLITRKRGALS